jgi:hypothetical protein
LPRIQTNEEHFLGFTASQLLPSGALTFVEASAKAKLTGSIETQPGHRLTALSALCICGIPIMASRNKDMGRQRVVFGFHCRKLGLDSTYRRSESL